MSRIQEKVQPIGARKGSEARILGAGSPPSVSIDEIAQATIDASIAAHSSAPHAHPATGITVAPTAGITATDVQAALAQISARADGYEHIQQTPATVWTVTHGLGTLTPSVTVYSSQGREVFAQSDVLDENTITITFSAAEYGKARVK